MNQKTILRNNLVLTQDFQESFSDLTQNSEVKFVVEQGDGECCSIRVFDDASNDADCFAFLLGKDDAERFSQAVLVHSGCSKVVSNTGGLVSASEFMNEVCDEFFSEKFVSYDQENDCYEFKENGYWIPGNAFDTAISSVEWFANLAEKNWITLNHINQLANIVLNRKGNNHG